MKLHCLHEVTFDTDLIIHCAGLIKTDEWALLLSSGRVTRYKTGAANGEHLFWVNSDITFSDGGFDLTAPSSFYIMDNIVAIVNDYKTHGYVYYPEQKHKVHLWRKDYHARHSRFPIALFKNDAGIPHLIYSTDWNRLEILDLDTLQILTAEKSLIEIHAEERHLEFYKNYGEHNTHPWPSSYDYFYGALQMAPGNRQFLSQGWVWGSADSYRSYDLDHFIGNNRIKDKAFFAGEHSARAACWIDEHTIALAYYPWREGDEGSVQEDAPELHIYDISGAEPALIRKFPFDALDEVSGSLYYHVRCQAFIAFTKEKGLSIYSAEGIVLLREATFRPDSYCPDLDAFLTLTGKTVSIHQLRSDDDPG